MDRSPVGRRLALGYWRRARLQGGLHVNQPPRHRTRNNRGDAELQQATAAQLQPRAALVDPLPIVGRRRRGFTIEFEFH